MTSWCDSDFPAIARDQRGFGLLPIFLILLAFTTVVTVSVTMTKPGETTAQLNLTQQRMSTLQEGITRFRQDNGANPANLNQLRTTTGTACTPDKTTGSATYGKLQGWCGPYVDWDISTSDLYLRDGWGVLLQYNGTTLTSCGPGRACGDADDVTVTL